MADKEALREFKRYNAYVQRRRQVPLTHQEGRQPVELPRGKEDGPLDHPVRGLVGALLDWSEGSRDDAARLLVALIKHLELQV